MTTATFGESIDMRITTRYLDSSWTREVRSLLYHTYRDDSVFQSLLEADRAGYDQRIRACTRELAAYYFSENMPVIGVLEGDRLIGVAFVSRSEDISTIVGRLLWKWKMVLTIGYKCTVNYLEYLRKLQEVLPEEHAYLLPLIGVHPRFRRSGHCRTLLKAVHDLSDLDQNGKGTSLCLSNEALQAFFGGFGYQQIGQVDHNGVKQLVLFRARTS
ncbi:hypothetical protein M3P05_08130 [Sansalvadorimonas sp. 2012CJ34-2]|uniref:Acetyltransferase (GNAT) family protein n=1 Tax=Parendozoicomonas callyspongiae TaxID=2942213 RepID=A0ABT0PF21_9GAMM|nr:hypothetical protein [Sansalvadorimonas sp. 2012CJ34-2]MCL6269903.1 hypothetical protein [Sansalvadorimonas sp. 2012CJ34-2]